MRGLFFSGVLFAIVAAGLLSMPPRATAATNEFCLCQDNLEEITAENFTAKDKELEVGYYCEQKIQPADCTPEGVQKKIGTTSRFDTCTPYPNQTACDDAYFLWDTTKKEKLRAAASANKGLQSNKSLFFPDCALEDELKPECRDISIFLILGINISRYLFSIVGGLSLLMFVYGGFTLIISQGNSEKIQSGKNIMVAVVIGLFIAFGGYILVNFLGQSLGLQEGFRLL